MKKPAGNGTIWRHTWHISFLTFSRGVFPFRRFFRRLVGSPSTALTLALIDQCAVTMPPYNFVSYEPLAAPYADEPGGKADARQDIPVAAEDDEEDDDMEMSPG